MKRLLLLLLLCMLGGAGCPFLPEPEPPAEPPVEPPPPPPTPPPADAFISGQLFVQEDSLMGIEPPEQAGVSKASRLQKDSGPEWELHDPQAAHAGDSPDEELDTFVPGELLVVFDANVSAAQQTAILAAHGLTCLDASPSGVIRVTCPLPPGADARAQRVETLRRVAVLQAQPGVALAEPNERRWSTLVPDDPHFPLQWHYDAINMPQAWDLTVGSDDIIVAVVDSGVLHGHPDLQGRLIGGFDFVSDPVSARDGDGIDPDPEDPGDLLGGPGQSSFHGTHMSGIIGATTNNALGVAGVTWQTRIMPLRALGMRGGTAFDVAEAIRYAAGLPNVSGTVPPQPARIINLSLAGAAGSPASAAELAAVSDAAAAGALLVGAAGNENSPEPAFPAAAEQVISVSAVDIQLNRAIYSNFGPTIELTAPGGFNGTDLNGDGFADGILSTGGSDARGFIEFQYVFSNGTSMATPQVSGVAALMMAVNPNLTAAQVREILALTAQDLGSPGRDDSFGHGLLDASAAVREAVRRAGVSVPDVAVLTLSVTHLDFSTDRSELQVRISNAGGGFLQLIPPAITEHDPGGWLGAHLAGSAVNASADTLVVTVDRTGLEPGTYLGTVLVQAEAVEPAALQVEMVVGPDASPAETIFVLAVRPPPELITVAQTQTSAANDFIYVLPHVPPGEYLVYAGTDRDNDGFICAPGDLCGALPSLLQPEIIALSPGEHRTNADFSLGLHQLQHSPSNPQQPLRPQRLDTRITTGN